MRYLRFETQCWVSACTQYTHSSSMTLKATRTLDFTWRRQEDTVRSGATSSSRKLIRLASQPASVRSQTLVEYGKSSMRLHHQASPGATRVFIAGFRRFCPSALLVTARMHTTLRKADTPRRDLALTAPKNTALPERSSLRTRHRRTGSSPGLPGLCTLAANGREWSVPGLGMHIFQHRAACIWKRSRVVHLETSRTTPVTLTADPAACDD